MTSRFFPATIVFVLVSPNVTNAGCDPILFSLLSTQKESLEMQL